MNKSQLKNLGKLLRESKQTPLQEAITKIREDIKRLDTLLVEAKMMGLLSEEAVETKPAADVWGEHKDASKTYISSTVYFVKPVKGGEKFEVTTEEGTTRKPFATLSKADLDKSFTPVRPNQTPDAEGYTQYRDTTEVEAFKNDSETLKIDDSGTVLLLTRGDYLLRKTDGENFSYEVKKAEDFESHYTEE